MTPARFSSASASHSTIRRFFAGTARLHNNIPDALLLLAARVFTAAIFFQSGRTKMNGVMLSENALFLFQEEYRLPWLNPQTAAYLTAFAEHMFPLMLLLGFATRLSALSLLIMTLVIQLFVYPDAWPTHGAWATLFLLLIAKGAGDWSVDFLAAKRWQGK